MNVVFHKNGAITKTMQVPTIEMAELNCGEGEQCLVTDMPVDPDLYWVSVDKLMNKEPFPAVRHLESLSIGDTVQIDNIPPGTTVVWPDNFRTLEMDGIVTMVAQQAFPLHFQFLHTEYLLKEVTIDVTP
jgi:hypothetical protein